MRTLKITSIVLLLLISLVGISYSASYQSFVCRVNDVGVEDTNYVVFLTCIDGQALFEFQKFYFNSRDRMSDEKFKIATCAKFMNELVEVVIRNSTEIVSIFTIESVPIESPPLTQIQGGEDEKK